MGAGRDGRATQPARRRTRIADLQERQRAGLGRNQARTWTRVPDIGYEEARCHFDEAALVGLALLIDARKRSAVGFRPVASGEAGPRGGVTITRRRKVS